MIRLNPYWSILTDEQYNEIISVWKNYAFNYPNAYLDFKFDYGTFLSVANTEGVKLIGISYPFNEYEINTIYEKIKQYNSDNDTISLDKLAEFLNQATKELYPRRIEWR